MKMKGTPCAFRLQVWALQTKHARQEVSSWWPLDLLIIECFYVKKVPLEHQYVFFKTDFCFHKQADEKKTGLPSYTSLDDEQQVATIMRSVSMDEDNIITANSDTQDLFVKVDSPEKHVEGYVSYAVTTKVLFFRIYT